MKVKFKYHNVKVVATCKDVDSMTIRGLQMKFYVANKLTHVHFDSSAMNEITELAHESLYMVKCDNDELNF